MGRVIIATTTFSKEIDLRTELALRTIEEAVKYSYPFVVVDGGSPEEFRLQLRERGAIVLGEVARGMGASRRQAMAEAAALAGEDGVVVWMEPEKWPFVEEISKVVAPILAGKADLVVPARANLTSYPPGQQLTESLGNLMVRYLTGQPFDFFFGPFAANQEALRYFLEYTGEYGGKWDSIYIPRLRVIAAGLVAMSVTVDYTHPQEQTEAESGDLGFFVKRIAQLASLILALWQEADKLGLV